MGLDAQLRKLLIEKQRGGYETGEPAAAAAVREQLMHVLPSVLSPPFILLAEVDHFVSRAG